jgi:hypothetical protein
MSQSLSAPEISGRLLLLWRSHGRHLLRSFAAISTVYGFWVAFNMDEYLPWRVRLVRGVELTAMAHAGLWLATLEWRGAFRFVVAVLSLLSMLGILFLWWHVGIPVQIWLGWRTYQLIRGTTHGSQSV